VTPTQYIPSVEKNVGTDSHASCLNGETPVRTI